MGERAIKTSENGYKRQQGSGGKQVKIEVFIL